MTGGAVRNHIQSRAEQIDGEWGCCHDWKDMGEGCAGYESALEALAALDRIEARAEAMERERDNWRGVARSLTQEVEYLRPRIAELERLERENAEMREALHQVSDNADAGGPLSLVADIARSALEAVPCG